MSGCPASGAAVAPTAAGCPSRGPAWACLLQSSPCLCLPWPGCEPWKARREAWAPGRWTALGALRHHNPKRSLGGFAHIEPRISPMADYPPLSSRSGGLLRRLWRPAGASRSSGGRPAVSAVSPSMPSIAQYRPVLPSIPCLACDRAPARTLPMFSWHGGGGAEEGRGVYGFVGMRWYGRLHIRV